jgi:hypothetical protein
MVSSFHHWVYWHFFTITVGNNISNIEIRLNDSCLANLSEESLTAAWISDWSLLLLWSLYSTDLSLSLSLYLNKSQSQSYITTDGQSASLSWNKAPIWGLRPDPYYSQAVASLFVWGAVSDKRTGQMNAVDSTRPISLRLNLLFSSHIRIGLRATPKLKRLVAGFPPRRPGFVPGSGKWDLWWKRWRWGRHTKALRRTDHPSKESCWLS